ncbi:hypothetical protein HPB50_018070 [Hyalomma asiaticum]|uniref:Uncharacterized protein n=1 Tax=Hyalomma asiaticum TaxID=266040 RepID=A0ACB7SM78_HYAAI|nr:hypothetical protein HPB50_018070 [Hyalomma asiaticum]
MGVGARSSLFTTRRNWRVVEGFPTPPSPCGVKAVVGGFPRLYLMQAHACGEWSGPLFNGEKGGTAQMRVVCMTERRNRLLGDCGIAAIALAPALSLHISAPVLRWLGRRRCCSRRRSYELHRHANAFGTAIIFPIKARATQRHLLWDCAPPPGNQEEAMPTAISSKIISREPGNQRDVVQHVLSILARQRPKAAPHEFDASRLLLRDVRAR